MPRKIRMVLFDMDGVLVPIKSSWEYIHKLLGVDEDARRIKEQFENGEIDYMKWMELDTGLWVKATNGELTIWKLQEMFKDVQVRENAVKVARWLRKNGIIIGIVSGGIDLLAKRIASEIGADIWLANQLSYDKRGKLIPGGKPLVGVRKDRVVKRIAGEYGVPLNNVMFVGDSVWDKEAMSIVGYPVIYGDCQHPGLENVAKYRISCLDELLDLITCIENGEDCSRWRINKEKE
ncbi:MAG: HAD-IB family phosphatase [Desulfurococcales archaeon]|nr:HAD-IB family phosphatase [Desulfurococcales archaeon]